MSQQAASNASEIIQNKRPPTLARMPEEGSRRNLKRTEMNKEESWRGKILDDPLAAARHNEMFSVDVAKT
eukprot:UN25416